MFIAAVTNETAWTGDASWSKLLFLRVQPSDYSVTFLAMLGKAGVHDHLDEIAVSSDGSELYFNAARCAWDSTNHNCEGSLAKVLVASDSLAWQKRIVASDPTNF